MYYDVYILNYLMKGPCYGYDIKKRLIESVSACTQISNNTLYPILKKYEQMGVTIKRVEPLEGKPSRVIYQITDIGRKHFVDLLRNYPDQLMFNRDDFMMRLAFFDYLDRPARERALTLRRAYLNRALELLDQHKAKHEEMHPSGGQLLPNYHRSITLTELELIDKYLPRLDDPCLLTGEGQFV